ncbi:MAG: hypothetical protein K6B75_00780 [Lachnospiraceae bacterium]|nr:hypothetical protein [Lachnospiraceae bacterium]
MSKLDDLVGKDSVKALNEEEVGKVAGGGFFSDVGGAVENGFSRAEKWVKVKPVRVKDKDVTPENAVIEGRTKQNV